MRTKACCTSAALVEVPEVLPDPLPPPHADRASPAVTARSAVRRCVIVSPEVVTCWRDHTRVCFSTESSWALVNCAVRPLVKRRSAIDADGCLRITRRGSVEGPISAGLLTSLQVFSVVDQSGD